MLNAYNSPVLWLITSTYSWGNFGSERVSKVLKVTQLANDEVGIEIFSNPLPLSGSGNLESHFNTGHQSPHLYISQGW